MNNIIIYHGSRSGIKGLITPCSREKCDFGQGFYMGTSKKQVSGLVCYATSPKIYELKLNLSKIPEDKILKLQGLKWAFFVLYNRNRLNEIKNSAIYKLLSNLGNNKDIIIGPIADDNMSLAITEFIKGKITDVALYQSLKAIDYGIQYVAKSDFACENIEIIKENTISFNEKKEAINYSKQKRIDGHNVFADTSLKYRRQGMFFDELLEHISKNKDWIPKSWKLSESEKKWSDSDH